MRTAYFQELDTLYADFVNLATDVRMTINKSVDAFDRGDVVAADQIIQDDEKINHQDANLQNGVIELIALQSPVAIDLRRLVTILKTSNDLERMGDHAKTIAYSTKKIAGNENEDLVIKGKILEMAEIVNKMLAEMTEALRNEDAEVARTIAKRDDLLDELERQVSTAAIVGLQTDELDEKPYVQYMEIAGKLERIGDYITNIGEQVVYLVTGEVVELNIRKS